MSALSYYTDSDSTSHLLANLNESFDEVRLVQTLSRLYDQVYHIETTVGPSRRTEMLRHQIAQLEHHLKHLRRQQFDNEVH